MIDYEIHVFDRAYRAAAHLCADGKFVGTQVVSPTAYPAAALVEVSNTTVRERQSSTPVENFSRIMYQLDCYALDKFACKGVFKAVDDAMIAMGFTRTVGTFLDNAGNPDVFRYTARYEAEIDPEGNIYRIG